MALSRIGISDSLTIQCALLLNKNNLI